MTQFHVRTQVCMGALSLALGIALLVELNAHALAWCSVDLQTWALVAGLLELVVGAVSGLLFCGSPFATLMLWVANAAVFSLARLGVLVWGTVLAFEGGRWAAHLRGDAATLGCDDALYTPLAILMICMWVLGGTHWSVTLRQRPTHPTQSATQ